MKDPIRRGERIRESLQQHDYGSAITELRLSVQDAAKRFNWGVAARQLGIMALLYHRTGRSDEALNCLEEALRYAHQDGDPITVGKLRGNQGVILREMGRHQEAIAYLEDALRIAEQSFDLSSQGLWLSHLGLVYATLGDINRARELHARSVACARHFSDYHSLASRLSHLAHCLTELGHVDEAQRALEEALTLYRELKMPAEIGQHCALLGNLHAVKGYTAPGPREAARAFKSALEHLDEAAAIADAHGQVEVLAALRVNIDHVLVALDELEDYLH